MKPSRQYDRQKQRFSLRSRLLRGRLPFIIAGAVVAVVLGLSVALLHKMPGTGSTTSATGTPVAGSSLPPLTLTVLATDTRVPVATTVPAASLLPPQAQGVKTEADVTTAMFNGPAAAAETAMRDRLTGLGFRVITTQKVNGADNWLVQDEKGNAYRVYFLASGQNTLISIASAAHVAPLAQTPGLPSAVVGTVVMSTPLPPPTVPAVDQSKLPGNLPTLPPPATPTRFVTAPTPIQTQSASAPAQLPSQLKFSLDQFFATKNLDFRLLGSFGFATQMTSNVAATGTITTPDTADYTLIIQDAQSERHWHLHTTPSSIVDVETKQPTSIALGVGNFITITDILNALKQPTSVSEATVQACPAIDSAFTNAKAADDHKCTVYTETTTIRQSWVGSAKVWINDRGQVQRVDVSANGPGNDGPILDGLTFRIDLRPGS